MKKPKPLRERITPEMLMQLQLRKITNREAAEKLGVCETYLSRVVSDMQKKIPGETAIARKAAQKIYKTRMEVRNAQAKLVVKGRLSIEKAAAEAGCSERTMFRYVAQYRE
jgi:hypothetical protein